MGSIMMHLCISDVYRKKHNLSDKFLVGSILPDIYKKTIMSKKESHCLRKLKVNDRLIELPDIDAFMQKNKENNKDELVIGYLAHLIEDYVWFNNIITEHVKESGFDENGIMQYRYKKENFEIIHDNAHFLNNIYGDYNYLDEVLLTLFPIDIHKIKETIKEYLNYNQDMIEVVEKEIIVHKPIEGRNNYFITEEVLDEYINMSLELLEEKIEEFIS